MNEFEEIIRKDRHLSKLLNDREITVFSNFSRTIYSDELKNYIQEKYCVIFKELYRQGIEDRNFGQANAIIRSAEFLATEKTKSLLADEFVSALNTTHENLLAFKASLSENSEEIHVSVKLDEPIDGLTVNIITIFGTYKNIQDYKTKIIGTALDICDIVSKVKPTKSPFKFALYSATLNNLQQFDDLGSFQERFDMHQGKISKKATGIEVKYVILLFISFVLILLKVLSLLLD